MQPTTYSKNICYTCHTPLNQESKQPFFTIYPCEHRIHMVCLKALDQCRACLSEIAALVKTDPNSLASVAINKLIRNMKKEFTLKAKLMEVAEPDPREAYLNSPYIKVEEAYFQILEKLIPAKKPSNKRTFQIEGGNDPIPEGAKDKGGFENGHWYWYKFLCGRTLENLNLSEAPSHDNTSYDETYYSADVVVLALNRFTEKKFYDSTQYAQFLRRLKDPEKTSNTYVIDLLQNPKPDFVSTWSDAKFYHVTDLKSLYKTHLKMAAHILQCDSEVLNLALSHFSYSWKSIMG